MSELREQLRGLIAEIGELDDTDQITDQTDLYQDLGLDSMQLIEIVLELERRFDIKIPEGSWRQIRTLDDALKVVQQGSSDSNEV